MTLRLSIASSREFSWKTKNKKKINAYIHEKEEDKKERKKEERKRKKEKRIKTERSIADRDRRKYNAHFVKEAAGLRQQITDTRQPEDRPDDKVFKADVDDRRREIDEPGR